MRNFFLYTCCMNTWKTTTASNINALSAQDAKDWLTTYSDLQRKNGSTIHSELVRNLTGGFNSQSMNFSVIRAVATRSKGGKITAKALTA